MHADGLGRWPCEVEVAVLTAVSTFRFSGECPGPRESITVRLIRPDDRLGHLGVQDRPHVSTAGVSTALAAGLCTRRPLTSRLPLAQPSSSPTPCPHLRGWVWYRSRGSTTPATCLACPAASG